MSIAIVCAGALSRPTAGSPDHRHPVPFPARGTVVATLARARIVGRNRDDAAAPAELPEHAWLRERFDCDPADSIAAHALFALPQAPEATGATSLLVRPVHLHVGLDHLVLAPLEAGSVSTDEAQTLADSANRLFAADGLVWQVLTPQAWSLSAFNEKGYQRIAALANLRCRSAALAAGRNIDAWQPEGPAARDWRAIVNELQMLWFDHPVNHAREEAAHPTLNSLWLEGRARGARRRAFDAVVCADEASAGLAMSCGAEASLAAADAGAEDLFRLVSIQEVGASVLVAPGWWRTGLDPDEAWARLDALLGRLDRARRPVRRVLLTGERDRVELARSGIDRWAFWRARSLASRLADCQ